MMPLRRLAPTLALLALSSGCGSQPGVAPTARQAAPAEARYFDRFEATVIHEEKSHLAKLEITVKGLVTRFTDDDFTLLQRLPSRSGENEQRVLFNSPLYLGQDGHLYLREAKPGRPGERFYQVGDYREARGKAEYTLLDGLKMEARNRSLLPVHGSGPYVAIVVDRLPMPVQKKPSLVRSL